MLALEAAQAACSILLPYAIKKIMDAVALAQLHKIEVWNEVEPALWLFAGLNLGIVLFSRASAIAEASITRKSRDKTSV